MSAAKSISPSPRMACVLAAIRAEPGILATEICWKTGLPLKTVRDLLARAGRGSLVTAVITQGMDASGACNRLALYHIARDGAAAAATAARAASLSRELADYRARRAAADQCRATARALALKQERAARAAEAPSARISREAMAAEMEAFAAQARAHRARVTMMRGRV